MPVFNGEKYLNEALDSICGQTFRDFELIVVNDGSVDGTAAILEEFSRKDPRVRVLTQANAGIVVALNNGLAAAEGEYVARMDADDISLPHRFAFQVDYLDRNPSCVIVGGLALSFQDDGTKHGLVSGGRHRHTDLRVFPPKVAVAVHPLIMARRHVLVALGGYRSGYPHAEDYDLFVRAAAFGTIDNPPEKLLLYRRHSGAISIRHVDVQERSAAQAEVDAISTGPGGGASADHSEIERWLFEPYVRFRIWRRYTTVDPARARAMLPSVIADATSLNMQRLMSWRYFTLRLRIAGSLAKMGLAVIQTR